MARGKLVMNLGDHWMRIDCVGYQYPLLLCVATLFTAPGCDSVTGDATQPDQGQNKNAPNEPGNTGGKYIPPQERRTVASGDISPQVIETLREQITSVDETERAEAVEQLGEIKDVDSLPKMVDALEDASPEVRQNAFNALRRLTNVSVRFDAHGSEEDRQRAVKFYRDFWEKYKDPDGPFMQISKNPSLKYTKYGQK